MRLLVASMLLVALLAVAACDSGSGGTVSSDRACLKSYPEEHPCLRLTDGDYDCEGGSGNGPNYIPGPVTVRHGVEPDDPFDLDRDGDGTGCDSY